MSEQVPGNMRHLRAALALLLGLHTALGHALVPAPEDVTVHCSDNRPRVSWNYRSHTSANFTVQLVVNEGSFQSQTRHHEFDLSDFIWSNKMQMFDFMYVKITATQGPNRSEPTRSCSFSYNMFKTVDITCRLKFPPVNLTSDGSKATLTFDNPLHFYKELKAIQPAVFELDIIMKNSTQHRQCFFSEKHCIFSLDFPENSNSCVNLTGHVRKGLEQIEVLHLEPVCPTTPPVDVVTEWVVAILSLVIIFIVIVAVTMAICKVRAWIFPKAPTPKTLMTHLPSQTVAISPSEVYSPVHIYGSRSRLNLQYPESEEVQAEDQVLMLPKAFQDDAWHHQEDHEDSGESTKTETLSINSSGSDEIEVTNYERRTRDIDIDMDLSGDVVKGYKC